MTDDSDSSPHGSNVYRYIRGKLRVEMESEYPRPAACTFKEPMIGYDGVSEHEHISNIPEILCNLQFPDWRYPTPRLDADSHKQRSCTPTTLCNARVVLLG